MLTIWRMTTAPFAGSAFSSEGARLHGGRWNPKGVPVVYTAATQSLATLEFLVQDNKLRARYVMIPATIHGWLRIERVDPAVLPGDWRSARARERLREIGADWVRRGASVVLAVPSVANPANPTTCYLLNPANR